MHIANRNLNKHRWTKVAFNLAASVVLASGCQSIDTRPASIPAPTVLRKLSLDEQHEVAATYVSGWQPLDAKVTVATASERKSSATPLRALAVPTPEGETIIDLAAAFQLAGVDNPTINLSREVVREAAARQLAAQALLLPNLTAGVNYHKHTGDLQASTGLIRSVDSQDLYFGAGAGALGANTVAIPGVRLFCHLGDAIYEPLAARQHLESRQSMAAATENNTLLDVAAAYFSLLGAEVRLEALRKGEVEVAEIVRLTEAFAKNGQGRVGDVNRAKANAGLVHLQSQETEADVAAASARLAALLNLDPSVRLRTPGGEIQPVQIIDENEDLGTLIQRGLMNRPEVRARLQELAEARTRVRQERIRPLLPTLSVGFSVGGFGGGSNLTAAGIAQVGGGVQVSPSFGRFDSRTDFDVFAVWTLQNAGAGNRALARRAEAVVGQAVAALDQTTNEVRREVAEALADTQAAARQMQLARTQLKVAEEGFHEEMIRIKGTVARALETIDSFRQLLDAQQEILHAVVIYNAAQYRLFVAVGASPLESTFRGPSGADE
jgi:outer membrane protein TolC